jgi:two-component system, NarL family, response regulator YdfI
VARVLIGASSEVVRTGLGAVLAKAPNLQVVGSFPIDTLLARIEDLQPDVVLLDLESAADESLPLEIKDAPLSLAIVVLTDNTEVSWSAEALRSGVRAILPRDATSEEIRAAIQAAAMGLVVLYSAAFDALLSPIPERSELDPPDQILTPREIEVLRMIAAGLGNKEIASKLTISDHTVKFHISSIFAKLGASSRTEAVTLGIRRGLIMI